MRWSDINFQPTTTTLRQFAALGVLFLLAIGGWQWWAHDRRAIAMMLASLALAVGAAGLARPVLLRWVFVGLTVATFPIGWLMSWILLGSLYYLVFAPIAICFRLVGRDALERRYNRSLDSYWSVKPRLADVRRYFRQY